MTDPSFDELASAHLDGATPPEEAARVAADPALLARVEELRRVREAVAEEPVVDPGRREAAISAALAAFVATEDTAPTAPVRLADRRRPSPTAVRILGAAAVVALLAVLIPVLGQLGSSDDADRSSEEATEAPDAAADHLSGAETAPPTTTTVPPDRDLGRFDDADALLDSVLAGFTTSRPATPDRLEDAAGLLAPACPQPTGTTSSSTNVEIATATVAGDPVVVVRQREDGVDRVLVYRTADCAVLGERAR
jgi:hypothetical protein